MLRWSTWTRWGDAVTSFREAVKTFEDDAAWLGAADLPALVTLRTVAEALDEGDMTPSLLAQFGLTYRSLLKRAPSDAPERVDPLEAALRDAEE